MRTALRQFRVLRMFKQQGYMNDASMDDGGLVLDCGACPIPGVNMPDGWEDREKS